MHQKKNLGNFEFNQKPFNAADAGAAIRRRLHPAC
jgi:hypothetical protein